MTQQFRTLPQLIQEAGERDLDGLVDGDFRLSFGELRDRIHAAGRALMASGVEKGDRVAVWAPNIGEWVIAAMGIVSVGGVLVPINTRFKGREAAFVLEKAKVRMLFTVTDFLDLDYIELLNGLDDGPPACIEEMVVMRGEVPDGAVSMDEFMARADAVDEDARIARSASVEEDDLCYVMFTSGTTGLPKGAMLRHVAICRGYEDWSTIIGMEEGDRYMVINPFFHSFGLNAGLLACLIKGATIVPTAVFDVPTVMELVHKERITILPGPPAIYQTILNHPDIGNYDLSSLRLAVTGAAAIPPSMVREIKAKLGFQNIATGYGLTENGGIGTMSGVDDPVELIVNTNGRAQPDVELRIVDTDGNEMPTGEPGEVVIRAYSVMLGYLDEPELTAETIDADGWLHTGDIGFVDDKGYLSITDRLKDMYIIGGFNAYPAEIEALMNHHPDIAQVAVIGMPDERMGEVGMAFVVPTSGTSPDADGIIAWCREEMANYKVPRRVVIVDELPLNASGKVLKYVLRDRATAEN